MARRLRVVSYYRLSGYWFPFRRPDDSFAPGTHFDVVWDRYVFDRRLRLLVMDAVERIEVAVRTQLSFHHSSAHGPFGYAEDSSSLPKLDPTARADFLRRLATEKRHARKEQFVVHFERKYGDHHDSLPIWMATEVMTFGSVLTLFRGASHHVKQAVATTFGMPEPVLDSWLLCLNTIRNVCAHHSRLWNRELGVKPMIPREQTYPTWHRPVRIENRRVFGVLTICNFCLGQIAPNSGWALRLSKLLGDFPTIPLINMGFPQNWHESPLWVSARP
jgi:abortive infection bacteriophage resistance protein